MTDGTEQCGHMRSTALPVSCIEDVTLDFLSHPPSFEFYGFQSLERGQLEIKTIYIYIYIYIYMCVCVCVRGLEL